MQWESLLTGGIVLSGGIIVTRLFVVQGQVLKTLNADLDRQRGDNVRSNNRINELTEHIEKTDNKIKILVLQNNECDNRNLELSIELEVLRKIIFNRDIEFDKVIIFILDDNPIVRTTFKHKFEQVSIAKVYIFQSIEEIMSRLNEKPDILILDYFIEHKTIDEVLRYISEIKDYYPKVVLISSMSNEEYLKSSIRTNVWRFFQKSEDYVNNVISAVLGYIKNRIK